MQAAAGAHGPAPGVTPGGSRAVALFGSFRLGEYYEDVLAGVMSAAQAAGTSVISIQSSAGVLPSGFESRGQEAVSRAAWDHFDSAIVILKAVSVDYVARLRAAGKFVVAIGQELRGADVAIALDNGGGVRDAVTHLAGHGHTRIGFVCPAWQIDAAERFAAYEERMAELGLPAQPRLETDLPPELSIDEQGYLAAQRFLRDPAPCSALLFINDGTALGFLRGMREAGRSVPDDVAVVGIDDVDAAAVSTPALATVAIDFTRVGEMAFEVARAGPDASRTDRRLVPQRLVPRQSCGCATGAGSGVASRERSAVDAFAAALGEAAQDGRSGGPVDRLEVRAVADDVVRLLRAGVTADAEVDRPAATTLATRITDLCRLDRSVQSVVRSVHTLARALAGTGVAGPDGQAVIPAAALDLCDAVRAGQLQRRMTEYVDLKRLQISHYFVANSLLGHDRDELRSLAWLRRSPADVGALGLWSPPGQTDRVRLEGRFDRDADHDPDHHPHGPAQVDQAVESFPPAGMLRDRTGRGHLVMITQVRLEESDWGLLAVGGGPVMQSSLVQETFQQWSIQMSASLDQERTNVELERQARELETAYAEVRLSEERYALAAEASRDALWDWDIATGTVFYSSNWKALLGFRDVQVGTSPDEWLRRVHPDDELATRQNVHSALDGVQQYLDHEHRIQVASGEYRWFACSGRTVLDDDRPVRLVGSITDVTVRRLLQEQLLHEARVDTLTGLARSGPFKDRLGEAFHQARERPERRFAVLYADLDGFKAVNDAHGHAAGDELLAIVAHRLTQSLRKHDIAARLGGDEFAVLMTDVDERELPLIVERIRALIRSPYQVGGRTLRIGVAIGVAVSGPDHVSADDMLKAADRAMYRAKRRNKQCDTRMATVS